MNNKNEIADLAVTVKEITAVMVQFIAANKQQRGPMGLILRQGLVRARIPGRK